MNLKEKGQIGAKLDKVLVIDSHAHYSRTWLTDFDAYIKKMDLVGVDKACYAFMDGDMSKAMELYKTYSDRILIYYWYDPTNEGEEVADWLDKPGVIGYKIHPADSNGYPCNGEKYRVMWEAAEAKKAVVLSHTWYPNKYCDPAMFEEIAETYPSVPIILGHSGGSIEGIIRSIEAANKYENIYLELDNVSHAYRLVEYLVEHVGISQILFGTDFATEDIGPHLGIILFAKIQEEAKKRILGLNMKELLERIDRYY